jgi:predicted aspartyl protease
MNIHVPRPRCLSRRRFVSYVASSMAVASMLPRAQGHSPCRPGADSSLALLPQQDAAPVAAATDAANHLTVSVRIDGSGPYRFVVDTGADRTVLAADIAAALGLVHGGKAMLEGVVRAVAAETVTIRDLSFGAATSRHLIVPILPRSMLEADGYLGLDSLDGHRVTFDFRNHLLQVSAPHSRLSTLWVRPSEARIHASGSSGHLRAIDCTVDGVAATAFVDTGAEVSAGNTSLLAALTSRRPTHYETGTIPLTDVTGGQIEGNVTLIKEIRLKDLKFTDCPLVIADFQVFNVWGLSRQPALLVGMNCLRQFAKVSIDYGLKEIRFDLASLLLTQPA